MCMKTTQLIRDRSRWDGSGPFLGVDLSSTMARRLWAGSGVIAFGVVVLGPFSLLLLFLFG